MRRAGLLSEAGTAELSNGASAASMRLQGRTPAAGGERWMREPSNNRAQRGGACDALKRIASEADSPQQDAQGRVA